MLVNARLLYILRDGKQDRTEGQFRTFWYNCYFLADSDLLLVTETDHDRARLLLLQNINKLVLYSCH
jgi:hypothetical protein